MRPARKRQVVAASMATTFSALFIAPQVLLPGAEPSAAGVLAGVGIPVAVAYVGLLIGEVSGAFRLVDTRTPHRTRAEPAKAVRR